MKKKLFAYGTLMTVDGFRPALGDRADELRFEVARLRGWKRVWNVHRAEWDGAVLNIEPARDGLVVGVLVEGLQDEDWARLDGQEGTHQRERVAVERAHGGATDAETYLVSNATYRGPRGARYEATVRERAKAAGPEVLQNLLEQGGAVVAPP